MTSDTRDRQDAPAAAIVTVLAAFVVGVGAVGASSVLSSAALRVLLALALIGVGWAVTTLASDRSDSAASVLGERVLRGIGTSLVVLGAYLLGLAVLTASVPDELGESGPSAVTVVLLVYGIPALALLAVVTTRMRVWAVGVGVILPMLLALLLGVAEVGPDAVSITMLVLSTVLTAIVLRAPAVSSWGDVASAAAAMSASFAFGAGTSPFGSLGTTQFGGTATVDGAGLTGGAQAVVTGLALVVGVVLLVLAVLRRDLASGVLVGSMFAMPPVLMQLGMTMGTWQRSTQVALIAVPALVALIAMVALRSYRFRRVLVSLPRALREPAPHTSPSPATATQTGPADGSPLPANTPDDQNPVPGSAGSGTEPALGSAAGPVTESGTGPAAISDAVTAAAFAVVLAAAAVVFVVLAMPVLSWDMRLQGVVALLVLVGVGALAHWLPGTAGAAAAVVALLGLALASPWARLLTSGVVGIDSGALVVIGVLDLVAACALVWLLVRRHRRTSVVAASAYLLLGSMAAFLGSLLYAPVVRGGPGAQYLSDWQPVLIVALPLLLLAIPAAVLAFGRWASASQAVGAVVLAAGGFLPMKVLSGEFVDGDAGYALQASLSPLTPTDWLGASFALRTVTGPVLVAVIALVLVGFVLVASLAGRPFAPLAAAVSLLLLAAVQASLLTALSEWSADEAETLGWALGAGALAAALIAVIVGGRAARRGVPMA
ncbi:hypothetical protein [Actinophytocola sediminis]